MSEEAHLIGCSGLGSDDKDGAEAKGTLGSNKRTKTTIVSGISPRIPAWPAALMNVVEMKTG
jgi:hypothetical protein